MKLPTLPKNLSFKEKSTPSNYYLTLTVGKEKADAVIFEETLKKIKVVGHAKEFLGKDLESIDDEALLNILDKVISTAEKTLPQNIETQNTIFGVDPSWVENGKIKKEQLLKLKKISDELELKPIGFIVTTEAISHLLQKEEGAPVSAILTEVGNKYLTATLLRGGRIIESKTAEITSSVPETLDGLLKHFATPEVLPSRIILFGENNEEMNQAFTSFSWNKTLPFLHLPQISPLESSLDSRAVLYGAASQMNFIVLDDSTLGNPDLVPEISDISDEKTLSKLEHEDSSVVENKEKSDEFFGFVEGTDVSKDAPEISEPKINPQTPPEVIGEQIQEIPEEMQVRSSESKGFPANALLIFSGIKPTIASVSKNLKLPKNLLSLLSGRGKILAIPLALIAIILAFTLYFFLFRSATVTISVSPKEAQKNQDVVFGEDLATDASEGTINAKYISVSEDGKLTTPATGKKETGDKAKGTVTIFNLSPNKISLDSGTKVTSSNNLVFTLDKAITVASPSGDATSSTPGKTDVTVTASTFGTESNLPSGAKFSVGDFSTALVAGKNDDAFSGGTSKNITVISNDDLTKLTSDMTKTLEDKAKQDIGGKISSSEILLPEVVSTSYDVKTFSKKVGEEASSVNLTATVAFKYITYSKDDLKKFAQNLFNEQSGENLVINADNTTTSADNIKTDKNDHTSADLSITTSLLPDINGDSLASEVSGKSFDEAQSILSKIPQVNNVSISVSPNPLFLPKLLPSSPKKIKIIVNTNG